MLAGLASARRTVTDTFAEASEALDYDLWDVCQNGPEERLNSTECTQPAMLSAGIAVWRVWEEQDGAVPGVLAGHSLGEYSALVCAGALPFSEAVRIVAERGRLMQEAVPHGVGAVAAILGLDDEDVRSACRDAARGEVVEAVNFNAPGQVVIAGHAGAVDRAIDVAKAAGARRAVKLPLSVPVHSSLMEPAARRFTEPLSRIPFQRPSIPVVANVSVSDHETVDGLRESLVRQLHSPVRWRETIEHFHDRGVDRLIECGPGKVLAGLNRRIVRAMAAECVCDLAGIDRAIANGQGLPEPER